MTKGVFTEEIGDRSSQFQIDQPMHPPLRDPVVPTFHESPRSCLKLTNRHPKKQTYQSNSQQMHTGHPLLIEDLDGKLKIQKDSLNLARGEML